VTGSFADPWRLEADGVDVDVLPVAEQFPIYGPALAVRADLLADRPGLVRDGVGAVLAGVDAARRAPADAARAVAEADGGPVDDERVARERRVFERADREFGASEAVREHGWGWHRADGWDRLETALDQVDLLPAT
jgi:ABC-type nitrate/sulfonate/bicarbonate transport system substrate-binding protein